MTRPRILIITRNLPPLVGGMERLNWHIADELSKHAEVQIVGPSGAAALQPPSVRLTEAPLRPLPRFLMTSAWHAMSLARQFRPDIVLAGSGLTAPAAWLSAWLCGGRSFVYLHGLDAAVQHPLYRALWHPAIRSMDGVIANSHATAKLAQGLGVAKEKIDIIHPGVQLPFSPQSAKALADFRRCHSLGDNRILLSVGRLTERKGLREFVQHALPAIVHANPGIVLAVVGDAPNNSLLAGVQSRDSIQAAADAAGVGSNIRFLGVITDPGELACAYEIACLHVFPVRQLAGDPEGFGMVAIEAAAFGTPTVAFASGGIGDAVAEGKSGYLIPPDNYKAMVQAILTVLSQDQTAWHATAKNFAQNFSWPTFGQRLAQVLKVIQ